MYKLSKDNEVRIYNPCSDIVLVYETSTQYDSEGEEIPCPPPPAPWLQSAGISFGQVSVSIINSGTGGVIRLYNNISISAIERLFEGISRYSKKLSDKIDSSTGVTTKTTIHYFRLRLSPGCLNLGLDSYLSITTVDDVEYSVYPLSLGDLCSTYYCVSNKFLPASTKEVTFNTSNWVKVLLSSFCEYFDTTSGTRTVRHDYESVRYINSCMGNPTLIAENTEGVCTYANSNEEYHYTPFDMVGVDSITIYRNDNYFADWSSGFYYLEKKELINN
jgi:hypothetical protein